MVRPSRSPSQQFPRVQGTSAQEVDAAEPQAQDVVYPAPEKLGAVDGVYSAYRYRNVTITFWFGAATMESLISFERGANEARALQPEGLSIVNIMVPGGRSMPSAEVRQKLGQIAATYAAHTAAVAVVIPGTGFWASALRGLVTAISMFVPRGYNLEIFGSFQEVAAWLPPVHAARTGVSIDGRELLRAMRAAETLEFPA